METMTKAQTLQSLMGEPLATYRDSPGQNQPKPPVQAK